MKTIGFQTRLSKEMGKRKRKRAKKKKKKSKEFSSGVWHRNDDDLRAFEDVCWDGDPPICFFASTSHPSFAFLPSFSHVCL